MLKNSTLLGISDCRLLKTRMFSRPRRFAPALEKGFSAACDPRRQLIGAHIDDHSARGLVRPHRSDRLASRNRANYLGQDQTVTAIAVCAWIQQRNAKRPAR
jgi:hypothetical protein